MSKEKPLCFGVSNGKNASDFWSVGQEHNKVLGDNAESLWKETLVLMRKLL
jgi:hypothetical protein